MNTTKNKLEIDTEMVEHYINFNAVVMGMFLGVF